MDHQLTLNEQAYCELRALTGTKRGSYREAFGLPEDTPAATLDQKAARLEARPEIRERIAQITEYGKEQNASKWNANREKLVDMIWSGILDCAHGRISKGKDGVTTILDADRAINTLANLQGWFPEKEQKIALTGTTTLAIDAATVASKLALLVARAQGAPPALPAPADASPVIEAETEE